VGLKLIIITGRVRLCGR